MKRWPRLRLQKPEFSRMSAPVTDYRAVETWLQKRLAEEIRMGWLGAAGLIFAGILVTWFTFWVLYAVLWVGFPGWIPHVVRLLGAASGTALLFVGNARTDREYLEEYSFTTSASDKRIVTLYIPGVGMGSNINPLTPDSLHALVKWTTTIFYSGPRLCNAALRLFRKTQRLAILDTGITAWLLAALLNRNGRVPFAEIVPQMPEHDPADVFPPLRDLEGVVFLNEEPPGLSLTADFRGEMLEDLRPTVQEPPSDS